MTGLSVVAVFALTLAFIFLPGSNGSKGSEVGEAYGQAPDASEPLAVVSYAGSELAGGPSEGIQVHGHWVIEVRDYDGSLVDRREFDNALAPPGNQILNGFLSRISTPGAWAVFISAASIGNRPCLQAGGQRFACYLVESTDPASTAPYIFRNLTITIPPSGPNQGKLVLSGTATAGADGSVENVETRIAGCSNTTTPATCKTTTGVNNTSQLTTTTLGTPIAVLTGQQISVTVVISFS